MKRETTYFERGNGPASFSLLYPPGTRVDGQGSFLELSPAAAHDLGLNDVVAAFMAEREHQEEIRGLFSRLPRNSHVISYRQAVLDDLLAIPELLERFTSLLPVIDSLYKNSYRFREEMNSLHELAWRVGELQNIMDCFQGIGEILGAVAGRIRSEGLRLLHEEIRSVQKDEMYKRLARELPLLLAKLQSFGSITIGVNLDASLRPVQATLLSVNEKKFTDQSILNRLFGVQKDYEGLAPLHSAPLRSVEGPYAFPVNSDLGWAVDPLMVPLFADLARVIEKTTLPIARQLEQYSDIQGRLFAGVRQGLIFYLGAVRFIRRFERLGLPMCRPEIIPPAERRCEVKDFYNVHLVLKHLQVDEGQGPAIITNDLSLGPQGHILILTGPNRGGKTTYMQGAGILHILAQAGCYVPGTQAVISPLDGLFTHFPLEEKAEADTGRFGEEAQRLGDIFEQVTRQSLVLLNESLSSTSFGESLYLAQDIVRMLRRVGARAIYSTHLHELANGADALNASVPGDSLIISVVASPIVITPPEAGAELIHSYKVEARPPLGQSYAREIAARYGISYQQLEKVLSGRGLLEAASRAENEGE